MPMYDDEGRLLVSLARVDRIIDADGDTYVHVAEDYIDFYVSGAQFGRIDANGLCLAEYLRHCGDLDTYIRFRNNQIGIVVGNVDILDIIPGVVVWNEGGADVDFRWETLGGTHSLFIDGANGKVFINDTVNTFALGPSLTIDGVGQDGEYLTLKDSVNIAHGMTTISETDTFGAIQKVNAPDGGLRYLGFTEGVVAFQMRGYCTNDDVNKNANAVGVIEFQARKKSLATYGNVGAGANVMSVRCQTGGVMRTMALFAEDGDLYLDTVVNVNHWDDYNDAELLRAGRLSLRPEDDPIRKQFDWLVSKFKPTLQEFGLMHYNDDGHHFMAMKKWVQLNADCNWQNYERIRGLEQIMVKIGEKLGISQKELLALTN